MLNPPSAPLKITSFFPYFDTIIINQSQHQTLLISLSFFGSLKQCSYSSGCHLGARICGSCAAGITKEQVAKVIYHMIHYQNFYLFLLEYEVVLQGKKRRIFQIVIHIFPLNHNFCEAQTVVFKINLLYKQLPPPQKLRHERAQKCINLHTNRLDIMCVSLSFSLCCFCYKAATKDLVEQ